MESDEPVENGKFSKKVYTSISEIFRKLQFLDFSRADQTLDTGM